MHPIVREGYRYIFISLLITVAVACWWQWWAVIPGVLTAFLTFFFRNPVRVSPSDDRLLYSPADGRVMAVSDVFFDEEFLSAPARKITIFLSVFDVHVNRIPMSGDIRYQQYTCGRFIPAFKDAVGFENERHAIGLDNGRHKVLVTQIAGILARRIVSWVVLGSRVYQGECYGMIKFGSCTELTVPVDTTILVRKGDRVIGGKTVVGRFDDQTDR
ncbi:MAG: phosphatidylserine decarboxylase family protein [Negativicutes bacterium]|nr:phosphatidylserine decarboxylase family protein [Negativicutes bacterium]